MKQGDIVTISFPFSELSARTIRPALVLSNNSYNKHRNLILAGIYGKATQRSIPLTNTDLVHKTQQRFVHQLAKYLQRRTNARRQPIDSLSGKTLAVVLQKVQGCF